MADEQIATWGDFMREFKGPLAEALKFKTPMLSEIRRNKEPQRWSGERVAIPLILAPAQGTRMLAPDHPTTPGAAATLGVPVTIDHAQASVRTAVVSHTISFTPQLIEQGRQGDTGWVDVIPTRMRMAEDVIGRVINEQICGTAGGLIAAVTSNSGSPGLAIPVGTSANFYQLYAGRVVDILTRSSGANPGNGLRRKIVSWDASAGTITVDTNAVATDGSSGNVTFSSNEGVYIAGSYGNALASIVDAVATTGTFEGINKANVFAFRGVNASPASAVDPSLATFDRAERLGYQQSGRNPDFYLADVGVVDKFSQGIATAARWAGDQLTLSTGFTGVRYRNKVIMPDYDVPRSRAFGISREDMQLYSLADGPDWDDRQGGVFQRFARSLPVEAWLVWWLQLGFIRCNTFIDIQNLNTAS